MSSRGYGGVGEAVAELAKFAEAVNHMIRIADMGAVAEGQRIVEGVGLKTATVVDNDDASDSLHATARIMCRIDRWTRKMSTLLAPASIELSMISEIA